MFNHSFNVYAVNYILTHTYVKNLIQLIMTLQTLLYQDVCNLQMMKIKTIFVYHVIKHYRRQVMRILLFHIMSLTNLSLVLQPL